MNEVLYEETTTILKSNSAKIKYNILKALSIISYALIFVWFYWYITFYVLSNVIIDIIVFIAPVVVLFLIGFFIGRLKNRFYQEYDYAFVSGTIRIAKVIKGVKRKFLLEFDCNAIEMLGVYGSETFYTYKNMPAIKMQILTPNEIAAENKDFYYIVANINAEKIIFIFECTKTLILNILKFSKKTILEKELKV